MDTKRYVVANSSFGVENISTLNALLDPAAEAGHIGAQNNLGYMFEHGEGVSADPHKAFEWIQKGMLSRIHPSASKTSTRSNALLDPAAEVGDLTAQNNLGYMFEHGKGVSADPHKAFEWYQKGMLSRIHPSASKMSTRSNALLNPAAEAGHLDAQNNLGYMFEHGKGVSADPHKAFEWYQKGMLSRIHPSASKISTRSTRFSTQPQKQDI